MLVSPALRIVSVLLLEAVSQAFLPQRRTLQQQYVSIRHFDSEKPIDVALQEFPDLSDLFDIVSELQSGVEKKERNYLDTIERLKSETQSTVKSRKEWQDLYESKIAALEQEATRAQDLMKANKKLVSQMVAQVSEKSAAKERDAAEKLFWLGDQLQKLKFDTHQTQLEASKKALSEQAELRKRLVDLETQLEKQASIAKTESHRVQDAWRKRMEMERELASVKRELETMQKDFELEIKSEKKARVESERELQTKLSQQQEAAEALIETALKHYKSTKQEFRNSLAAQDAKYKITIDRLRKDASEETRRLHDSLQTVGSEYQQFKFEAHRKLMEAKDTALEQQAALQAQLDKKMIEIQAQANKTADQSAKAQELWSKRMELEKELSTLQHKYDEMVADWRLRYQKLEQSRLQESRAVDGLLEKEKLQMKVQLEAAAKKILEERRTFKSGLFHQQAEHSRALNELQSKSQSKESELVTKLAALAEQLQSLKFDSHGKIMAEKAAADQVQAELKRVIAEKEGELERQAQLTAAADVKVREAWERRMELEREMSALRHKYDAVVAELEERNRVLENEKRHVKETSKAMVEKSRLEATELVEAALKEANVTKEQMMISLNAKEAAHKQAMVQLKESTKKRETELVDTIQRISNELQQQRFEAHRALMAEKEAFEKTEASLLAQIEAKETALKNELVKLIEKDGILKGDSEKRLRLAQELSDLKHQYEATAGEWANRYKSLSDTLSNERRQAELFAARQEAEARALLDAALRESEEAKASLERRLNETESLYQKTIEEIRGTSASRETHLESNLEAAKNALSEQKAEFEGMLAAQREAAEARQSELRSQIDSKEEELRLQIEATESAAAESDRFSKRASEVEQQLENLKHQYDGLVSEWQNRFNDLQKARDEDHRQTQSLLAQKEEETKAELDAVRKEVEANATSLQLDLATKEAVHNRSLDELRSSFDAKESSLLQQLESIRKEMQSVKEQAEQTLFAEREAAQKEQEELRNQVMAKERELEEQSEMSTAHSAKVDEMWRLRMDLETEVSTLKHQLEDVSASWSKRCNELKVTFENEKHALLERLATQENESLERLEAAKLDIDSAQAALKAGLEDRDAEHELKVKEIEESWKRKEEELSTQIQKLRDDFDTQRAQSEKILALEKENAIAERTELLRLIEEKDKALEELEAAFDQDRSRMEDVSTNRRQLEAELAALREEFSTSVSDWQSRCETLKEELQQERLAAAQTLATREAELESQIELTRAEYQAKLEALEGELQSKDSGYHDEILLLQDQANRKETELSNKLNAIRAEFDAYKAESERRLAAAKNEMITIDPEREESVQYAVEEGYRLAERVRYDLTKQLVKKEMKLLRQKAELRQKDAQIAALKAGADIGEIEERTRLNLSSVKDRVASILRKEASVTPRKESSLTP